MLFLCETLKNISSNYILIKKRKIDYRKPKWMTTKILAALKKSSKRHYANPSMANKDQLKTFKILL